MALAQALARDHRRHARLPDRSREQRRRLRRRRIAASRVASTRGRCSTDPRKAYVVLGAEPEFDCANPVAARAALDQAEFVVVAVAVPPRHGVRRRAAADRAVHRDGRHVRELRRPRAALQRRGPAVRRDASRVEGAARAGLAARPAGIRFRIDRRRARRRCPPAMRSPRGLANGTRVAIATPAAVDARASSASPTCRSILPIRSRAARRRCSRRPMRSRRARG